MKKWSLSFDDLLADETGMTEFEIFLKKEYSHENIRFYRACKELISAPLSRVKSIKASIERCMALENEPRHDKTCLREFPTRPDTNWPAQPQKLAGVLKFRL